MFKSATIYKLRGLPPNLEESLEAAKFVPCGSTQELAVGWVPARGVEHGAYAESIMGQLILRLAIETKSVPASELKKAVEQACKEIEQSQGRKPGRKERLELKEDAALRLLPNAFPKRRDVLVWIDRTMGMVVIDAASGRVVDLALAALASAGVQLDAVQTAMSPQALMINMLMDQADASRFFLGRECELSACDETKSKAVFKNHMLDLDAVRWHLQAGKVATKLALRADNASFVLTANLALKNIDVVDIQESSVKPESADSPFDADVAIFTGTMTAVLSDLMRALGGVVEPQKEDA